MARLLEFTSGLKEAKFTTFARGVEIETTRKNGNLILNVDGAMAAVLLDLLAEREGYTLPELRLLADTEFFNSPVCTVPVGWIYGPLLRSSPPR